MQEQHILNCKSEETRFEDAKIEVFAAVLLNI
jgi:hypothetical protein